jgi:hypothetical protein
MEKVRIFNDEEIDFQRSLIENCILKQFPDISTIDEQLLSNLFQLYDANFFERQISSRMKDEKVSLVFRITKYSKAITAGKCMQIAPNIYEMRFPFSIYESIDGRTEYTVGGIKAYSRIRCLQLVFEHELMHFVFLLWGFYNIDDGKPVKLYGSHGKAYKSMLYAYFGHTEISHGLNKPVRACSLPKEEVEIGMKVKFYGKMKSDWINGKVIKINPKRCKVKVNKTTVYDVPYYMLNLR